MISWQARSIVLESAIVSINLTFSLTQLLANIFLAIDRYSATKYPLMYRQVRESKKGLMALLVGTLTCIIFGTGTGCLSVIYQKAYIASNTVTVSRIISIILLALLYYMIFRNFATNRVHVISRNNSNARNPCGRQPFEYRTKRHLFYMCFGISASFAILNLPISVYTAFNELGMECDTTKGKLVLIFVFFVKLNMIFDSLWYFYMEKQKKTRNA